MTRRKRFLKLKKKFSMHLVVLIRLGRNTRYSWCLAVVTPNGRNTCRIYSVLYMMKSLPVNILKSQRKTVCPRICERTMNFKFIKMFVEAMKDSLPRTLFSA